MKIHLYILFSFFVFLTACNSDKPYQANLPSPHAKVLCRIHFQDGELFHMVYFNNKRILDWSKVNFDNNILTDSKSLEIVKVIKTTGDQTIPVAVIEFPDSLNRYNEIRFFLGTVFPKKLYYQVTFRVYDYAVTLAAKNLDEETTFQTIPAEVNFHEHVQPWKFVFPDEDSANKDKSNIETFEFPAQFKNEDTRVTVTATDTISGKLSRTSSAEYKFRLIPESETGKKGSGESTDNWNIIYLEKLNNQTYEK